MMLTLSNLLPSPPPHETAVIGTIAYRSFEFDGVSDVGSGFSAYRGAGRINPNARWNSSRMRSDVENRSRQGWRCEQECLSDV